MTAVISNFIAPTSAKPVCFDRFLPSAFTEDAGILDIGCGDGAFSRAVLERGARRVYATESDIADVASLRLLFASSIAQGKMKLLQGAVWSHDIAGALWQRHFNRFLSQKKSETQNRFSGRNFGIVQRNITMHALIRRAGALGAKPVAAAKLDVGGAEWVILPNTEGLEEIRMICGTLYKPDGAPLPPKSAERNKIIRSFVQMLDARGFSTCVDVRDAPDVDSCVIGTFWARNRATLN